MGLTIHYSLGGLCQEENQYLGCPAEVLQSLLEKVFRWMGYARGACSPGFVDRELIPSQPCARSE